MVLGVEMRTPTKEVLDRNWVSIEERWIFNKCKMVFHSLSDQAPMYLATMFIKSQLDIPIILETQITRV